MENDCFLYAVKLVYMYMYKHDSVNFGDQESVIFKYSGGL